MPSGRLGSVDIAADDVQDVEVSPCFYGEWVGWSSPGARSARPAPSRSPA